MQTCGFMMNQGEFTYRVGLPGKSGIGGGIVALFPTNFVVAWSPKLNKRKFRIGNACLGIIDYKTGMSVF
jgi:glutaminase